MMSVIFAFVAGRPEMPILARIQKLSRDAHAITRPQHRTFDHRIDVEFGGNLGQVFLGVLELHHGRPRDNPKRVDLR
jgi:hypothetical protein